MCFFDAWQVPTDEELCCGFLVYLPVLGADGLLQFAVERLKVDSPRNLARLGLLCASKT